MLPSAAGFGWRQPAALIGQMDRGRSGPLMAAIDACNARWGAGSVVPARAGVLERRDWSTKFEMRAALHSARPMLRYDPIFP